MERLFEIAVVAVILYFAWQGAVAVDHFTSPIWNHTLSRGGAFRTFHYWLYGWMPGLMLIGSAGLILNLFVAEKYQPNTGGGMLLFAIGWAFMGWWQKGQFAERDPQMIAHTLYSLAALLTSLLSVLRLIAAYRIYKAVESDPPSS